MDRHFCKILFLLNSVRNYFLLANKLLFWGFLIYSKPCKTQNFTDLLNFENMKIDKCGMGLQTNFCVLQSLIGDLPILCLNDPSAGIDILAKYALREAFNHVREMGRALIITTHKYLNKSCQFYLSIKLKNVSKINSLEQYPGCGTFKFTNWNSLERKFCRDRNL